MKMLISSECLSVYSQSIWDMLNKLLPEESQKLICHRFCVFVPISSKSVLCFFLTGIYAFWEWLE